jgi:sugar phosphate isomerase/epimerase
MRARMSRRKFIAGLSTVVSTMHTFPSLGNTFAQAATALSKSPFKISVINDEISQDFGHACSVASRQFGMGYIELRSMWDKNVLKLSSNEIAEAQRILKDNNLQVTDIASPLFKVDWPGAPKSRFSPRHDQFNADFTFDQQEEVLERSIELAKIFRTDQVRCFDFWRLDQPKPYREGINARLQNAAEKAGRSEITLVLENEPACNTATAAEAAHVLSAVKSKHLMLNWDPGNASAHGEQAYPDGYNLLPKDRIGHCHCKDVIRKADGFDWAPMGHGVIDWVGQFRALKRDGYHGGISLETHWRGAGTPEASTRQSWTGMKEDLQKAGAI